MDLLDATQIERSNCLSVSVPVPKRDRLDPPASFKCLTDVLFAVSELI